MLHSYHLGLARGMSDGAYVDLVERLDKEIAAVEGHGFSVTPFERADGLSDRLGFGPGGGVWVKDETGNVSGSHKARHLFGLLLHLAVVEETGLVDPASRPDLAIASCGNAALAAAVVARAANRRLQVFVPTWADPSVLARLRLLEASIETCERAPGVPGDPIYQALRIEIARGALPFTCQGNENGLSIEGGQTLGYEMVTELLRGGDALDRVFVQVGGGALASAVAAAFSEARDLGAIEHLPRFHAIQTRGAAPLARAYDLVSGRVVARIEADTGQRASASGDAQGRADFIRGHVGTPSVQTELEHATQHRSEFMWPWEDEPRSAAEGILDDETYDWLAAVRAMISSGGSPVVVNERRIELANELGRATTGIDVDHTGTSGLAGLLQLRERGGVGRDEKVAVLFTGARR
jgi:threonine synthase